MENKDVDYWIKKGREFYLSENNDKAIECFIEAEKCYSEMEWGCLESLVSPFFI